MEPHDASGVLKESGAGPSAKIRRSDRGYWTLGHWNNPFPRKTYTSSAGILAARVQRVKLQLKKPSTVLNISKFAFRRCPQH